MGQIRVLGRPYYEWAPVIAQHRRDGEDTTALQLAIQCIDAAERDRDGREPAPHFTEVAAKIFRARGDLESEVAIIERWAAACPAAKRGTGAATQRLGRRLIKARQLLARSNATD